MILPPRVKRFVPKKKIDKNVQNLPKPWVCMAENKGSVREGAPRKRPAEPFVLIQPISKFVPALAHLLAADSKALGVVIPKNPVERIVRSMKMNVEALLGGRGVLLHQAIILKRCVTAPPTVPGQATPVSADTTGKLKRVGKEHRNMPLFVEIIRTNAVRDKWVDLAVNKLDGSLKIIVENTQTDVVRLKDLIPLALRRHQAVDPVLPGIPEPVHVNLPVQQGLLGMALIA